jgi:hypothetical protein
MVLVPSQYLVYIHMYKYIQYSTCVLLRLSTLNLPNVAGTWNPSDLAGMGARNGEYPNLIPRLIITLGCSCNWTGRITHLTK